MKGKPIRADFHIHTSRSDGKVCGAEVVALAGAAGLDTLAITDHDSVGALEEAAAEARRLGLRFVPGAELTAYQGTHEIHLLAYFPSLAAARAEAFTQTLARVQEARRTRLRKAVAALRLCGVLISESDVFHGGAESYGRLHLARAIVHAGFARSENEAFSKYLDDRSGTVPPLDIRPQSVVAQAHALGALVFWAHPSPEEFARFADALVAAGIDGVETANFRRVDATGRLTAAVRARGLLESGGSDWHGSPAEPALGTHAVGPEIAERFLAALYRRAA